MEEHKAKVQLARAYGDLRDVARKLQNAEQRMAGPARIASLRAQLALCKESLAECKSSLAALNV